MTNRCSQYTETFAKYVTKILAVLKEVFAVLHKAFTLLQEHLQYYKERNNREASYKSVRTNRKYLQDFC